MVENSAHRPLQSRDRMAEDAAGTMGEVRFRSVEATDEWNVPFPVLGAAAELTDE